MIITLLTGKTSKLKEQIKDELNLDVKVNRSSRSIKLTLKIDTKSQIPTLSIPKLCSNKRAFEFIKNHKEWIEDKLSQAVVPTQFKDGDTISLFGKKLTIKHCPGLKAGVFVEDSIIKVSGEKSFLHRRVKDFIKKSAKQEFFNLTKECAKKINYRLNNVVIKDTISRWGSCSSNSNINYNWRVALAPYFVAQYLVAHETAHLKHQDHSKDFWDCVKSLNPEYLKGRDWLKTKGKELYIYE